MLQALPNYIKADYSSPRNEDRRKGLKWKGLMSSSYRRASVLSFLREFWLTFGTAAVDMKKLSPSFFFFLPFERHLKVGVSSLVVLKKLLIFKLTWYIMVEKVFIPSQF